MGVLRPGIYIFGSKKLGWYKIGLSKNVESRFETVSRSVPFDIERISFWPGCGSVLGERYIQSKFSNKRLNGEWFALSDADIRECEALVRHDTGEMLRVVFPAAYDAEL